MTPERLQAIETIFHSARELDPSSRSAFLDEACSADQALRTEIEALLNSHDSADGFIARPAAEITAEVLAKEQAALAVGRMFGHYQLLEPLGRGGMGDVYLATDTRSGRKAALKLLPLRFTGDAERFNRFQREARTVIALNHPNIVTIYEIGEDDSTHYIVSELIEGETLRERLTRGRVDLGEALEIAPQIASALTAAHRAGIVHRDIKPENIMLRPDGYVKVLDFGIAKLAEESDPVPLTKAEAPRLLVETSAGRLLGTARYMSPEQARGLSVDERTDIWSLGVVLYEMVAGCTPFNGETPTDVIVSILTSPPSTLTDFRAEVSAELQQVIAKALRKDRQERYGSVNEMADALKELRRNLEVSRLTKPVWWRWAALAMLIVALAVSLPFLRMRSKPAEPEKIPSIAVLPFENLSRDPDNAYFTEGIQEEILTRLSKISGLKVISRTSTQKYKSTPDNLREIAHQLGVTNILEGSVQKKADQIRVNVQLINAQNDSHLWADRFDRKLADIFAVESEIATRIADTLQAKLTGSEQNTLRARPTENSEAHQLYLKGRFFWNKRTAADLHRSIDYFKQAIEKDPDYALAYSGMADAYILLPAFGGAEPGTGYANIKEAADKAIALDPNLADPHASIGLTACFDFDLGLSRREFEKAITLNPNYATAHHWLGNSLLLCTGDFERSIAELKRALELDPLSLAINIDLGVSYLFAGQYSEGIAQEQKALELDGNSYYAHYTLGELLESSGNLRGAIAEYEKAVSLDKDPLALALLGRAQGLAGNREKAQQILRKLTTSESFVPDYALGLVNLGLGEKNAALDAFERSFAKRQPDLFLIRFDPLLKPLRGDPRFEKLAEKIVPARELDSLRSPNTDNRPSIAVLPFENFSDDKTNVFFAQGIQDEILTALSKISGLKVISRTSTAQLKSKPANLAEIAQQLGVRNILEGSVQKAGERVHINVQLVDAESGGHLWAQSYDRKLTDAFAVEGEVAKSIADCLEATLTPQEIARVQTKPTNNPDAYVLYLRAIEIIHRNAIDPQEYDATAKLLQEAIALDPNFALAHARLSRTYGLIAHFIDPSPARRDQALAEAKEALRLEPNLGEGHQALALCHYWGRQDYPAALAELAIAKRMLPNDAENSMIEGAIARRQGKWKEAIECFQRELTLDPRSIDATQEIEKCYFSVRDWPAAIQASKQALAVLQGQSPDLLLGEQITGAYLRFYQSGNVEPIRAVLNQRPADFDPNGLVSFTKYDLALLTRDFAAAQRAIEECKVDQIPDPVVPLSKSDLLGLLHRARGEDPSTVKSFLESRIRTLETEVDAHPEDARRHGLLGMAYAYVGRKDDAIREGRRAVELKPESDDAPEGANAAAILALIYAQVGEPFRAIPLLERLLTVPGPVDLAPVSITQADLRLRWEWDPLRKDPRFQKLISGSEPKTNF